MAGPLYPNQPLVEVTTEVRFKGELEIEAIRPAYQSKVREQLPNLFVPNAKEGKSPYLQPIRFEDKDGITGIQLAINSFSIYTRQYPGHEEFLGNLNKLVGIFLDLIHSIQVTRVGWRYINVIPFSRENGLLPLNRYFQKNDYFGNALELGLTDMNFNTLKPIDERELNITLETASTSTEPVTEVFLLDIDIFNSMDPCISTKDFSLTDEIKSVHDAAYNVFESMISPIYREYLKGNDNE